MRFIQEADMNSITGTTRLTALLGSPVSHSISPLMHNEAFRILGLDYVYLCFDVDEEALPAAVEGLKRCGIRGFNLTMPDKNRIVDLVDQLSPAARLIGAVNTVVVENGILTGHNTDGAGFVRSAEEAGFSVKGADIVLLGAGGAASAIAAQAALDGAARIRIFRRSSSRFAERVSKLCSDICAGTTCTASFHDLEDTDALREALAKSDLLINATPVGMAPDTDRSLITDPSVFRKDLAVADIIYNPRETRLLKEARQAGCRVMNGMYMLLYQGAEAFRLFTGMEMPVDEIRAKYFR